MGNAVVAAIEGLSAKISELCTANETSHTSMQTRIVNIETETDKAIKNIIRDGNKLSNKSQEHDTKLQQLNDLGHKVKRYGETTRKDVTAEFTSLLGKLQKLEASVTERASAIEGTLNDIIGHASSPGLSHRFCTFGWPAGPD